MPFPLKQRRKALSKKFIGISDEIEKKFIFDTPESLALCLQNGYDMFGLIEKGFANDRHGISAKWYD